MKKLLLNVFFGGLLCLFGTAQAQISSNNGTYQSVLKIPSLENAPSYFYVNTNIPATDVPAPQIQITGYMYGSSNKALKITLSWYHYAGNFYWTQLQSDLGYYRPSRVRLGLYTKAGTEYIRIEIANDGVYWSNYTFSATDRADFSGFYQGWNYVEGEMPAGTAQVTVVSRQDHVVIDGNLGIGTSAPTEKLSVNGKIRAKEVKVEAANWPDYVFEEGYKNLGLTELDAYIKKNKHLPEVPSAREIEANGVELGALNKLLLKKLEELTLHLIDKDKLIQKSEVEIETSKQRISIMEYELKRLHMLIDKILKPTKNE